MFIVVSMGCCALSGSVEAQAGRALDTPSGAGLRARPAPAATSAAAVEPALEPRSLGDRYADALAGSWAATGILVGAGGLVGLGLGGGIGAIVRGPVGGLSGMALGGIAGGLAGWLAGPFLGADRGASLSAGEAFAAGGLGILTAGAMAGLGTLLGYLDDVRRWGHADARTLLGAVLGTTAGLVLHTFLTPLYAVLLFEDRPEEAAEGEELTLAPVLAPSSEGVSVGVMGSF